MMTGLRGCLENVAPCYRTALFFSPASDLSASAPVRQIAAGRRASPVAVSEVSAVSAAVAAAVAAVVAVVAVVADCEDGAAGDIPSVASSSSNSSNRGSCKLRR